MAHLTDWATLCLAGRPQQLFSPVHLNAPQPCKQPGDRGGRHAREPNAPSHERDWLADAAAAAQQVREQECTCLCGINVCAPVAHFTIKLCQISARQSLLSYSPCVPRPAIIFLLNACSCQCHACQCLKKFSAPCSVCPMPPRSVGDAGVEALATAMGHGALPLLQSLQLSHCALSDDSGCVHLIYQKK